MPSKRPAPLSDASLVSRCGLPAVDALAPLGETNDGVPLRVKNTFIELPSPMGMNSAHAARAQVLKTAPAELQGYGPGFIKRAVVASTVTAPGGPVPSKPAAEVIIPASPTTRLSPTSRSVVGVTVQRPQTTIAPSTSQTPSPTGSSVFSTYRYQLFGSPAPVQEATHSTFAPQAGMVSSVLPGPIASSVRQIQTGPLITTAVAKASGATTISPNSTSTSISYASSYSRPAAAAAKFIQKSSALNEEREAEDDDDDSDDEKENLQARQQAAANGITRAEDAPKPPPGAKHPSMGSEQHDEGTCKRCCFFPRNKCLNGYNCEFCHYDHEKRKRKSKKKQKKGNDDVVQTDPILTADSKPVVVTAAPTLPTPSASTAAAQFAQTISTSGPLVSQSFAYSGAQMGQVPQVTTCISTAPQVMQYQSSEYLCNYNYHTDWIYGAQYQQFEYQPDVSALAAPITAGYHVQDTQGMLLAPYHGSVMTAAPPATLATTALSTTAPATQAYGLLAPPVTSPKLPSGSQAGSDLLVPPPVEAPRTFSSTPSAAVGPLLITAPPQQLATVVQAAGAPTTVPSAAAPTFAPKLPMVPPPMSSPKLPKDITNTLQHCVAAE